MRKRTIALLLAFTMMLSLFTPLPAYAEDEANDAPNLELGAPEGTDDVDSETCTHEYGDWIIDTEPQVGTDGLKHRECALCGNTESEVIPPLKEDETSEEDVPPADTETPPAQPDPAPGKEVCDHEYGEWQLRTEPTMDEAGSQFRVCQLCGEEEEERIPALSEITNGEGPHGDGVVYCPHGHVKGEICYECGTLTHSDKNIPMLGYDMDFFAQHMPPEDVDEEDLILYSLFSCRLICRHGVADGLYCDACGGLVNVQAEDIPSCWWFDSCMHGKIRGEKCPECQELKESQGDYELMEGEEWADPLIYGTETTQVVADISYIYGNYRYCIWCDDGNRIGVSRPFNEAYNVLCHVDSNGRYHWDYINRVEGNGTCAEHDTTIVYNCGARQKYSHHSHSCTYNDNLTKHTEVITEATCQSEGKEITYYTAKCKNCGAEGPAADKTTVSIPKLTHLYTDAAYLDSENHLANCSGNNTAAHQNTVKHTFTQTGEDYHCSDCDAEKTTVHIDVCSKDGTVLKADLLANLTVEVGHNGPASVSIVDYQEDAYKAAVSSGFVPLEEQNSEETVQLGGVHLKYYCNQITSIEVKDHKETYYRTDNFVDQGTIVVHYLDGTTEEVSLVKDKVTAGFDTSTVGTKTLTVTHNGMSTTCDIEVLWIPAKIKVEVLEGYAQSKLGTIVITGDGDFVTMPDGSIVPCGEVDTYLFTENGDFLFTVTGMDKGTDTDTVHMDLIDTEAPILTAELKDGKLTISSYDDLSGLKDITYLEVTDTTAEPLQHIGEENKKTLEASVDGVADGVYRIVATDHAGNSRNFDIAINVEAEPDNTPFSMYVPSSISFYVDKEGAVTYIPDDTQIYNYPGEKPISIKAITVSAQNDWTLVDYDTDFSQYEKDSAYVALSINGNKVNANGTVQINVEDWVIAEQSSLPLVLDIKVPAQSESRELPNVLKLNFTGDWYNEGDVVGQKQLITIMEDENCSYSPNVTAVYTNNFGKITYLPRVIPEGKYYTFVNWVNTNTNEEIKVGQILTDDISIKPVVEIDPSYVRIDWVSGENGSITGDTFTYVKKDVEWKDITKPTVTPNGGYELQGWYNEQNILFADNTKVSENVKVTAKFKEKNPWTVTTTNLPSTSTVSTVGSYIIYSQKDNCFILAADTGSYSYPKTSIYKSQDGINWSKIKDISQSSPEELKLLNGQYILITAYRYSSSSYRMDVYYGSTPTFSKSATIASTTAKYCEGLVYCNGEYIVSLRNSSQKMYSSTNLSSWNDISYGSSTSVTYPIVYNNKIFGIKDNPQGNGAISYLIRNNGNWEPHTDIVSGCTRVHRPRTKNAHTANGKSLVGYSDYECLFYYNGSKWICSSNFKNLSLGAYVKQLSFIETTLLGCTVDNNGEFCMFYTDSSTFNNFKSTKIKGKNPIFIPKDNKIIIFSEINNQITCSKILLGDFKKLCS